MELQQIGSVLYWLIASLAMVMTSSEQRAKGQTHIAYNLAGLLACAAWPLALLVLLLPDGLSLTQHVPHSSDA